MIHLFINAISASAGGGLTYVRNVLPRLATREGVRVTLLVPRSLGQEMERLRHVTVLQDQWTGNSAKRLWHEQRHLPGMVRRSAADVLLSTGNFALYRSPVPQILLSRNALYISADFIRDLRERGDYRLWLDTEIKGGLARWSVRTADCTVAPSATFAGKLCRWTGKNVMFIHHGFDHELFFREHAPLPESVQASLAAADGSLRLLFVSHYNYYRNFETLIRAVSIIKTKLHPRTVRLILTCKFNSNENPGEYQADAAAHLVRQLGLRQEIVELGGIPYQLLHNLYRACNLYVTPAYAETFAHPLVEAMASGIPVIASDLPVHQEICGDAALYFPRFSPEALAGRIIEAYESAEKAETMRQRGLARSSDFSWDKHVDDLLQLA